MSYATYTTKALVCGTWAKNTSDKSYLLFTREAGMLYASARSVREEKSKQRFALQDFSRIKVSLVKGKAGWRIGSVEALENFYNNAASREARGSVVALYKFLRRFYKGEEAHLELYDELEKNLNLLTKEIVDRESVELIAKLKILTFLGYVNKSLIPNIGAMEGSEGSLSEKDKKTVTALIDNATDSSQL